MTGCDHVDLSPCSEVAAGGDRADDQLGRGVDDGRDPTRLGVQVRALPWGERPEGLDRQLHRAPGAPLVPDAGDGPVDEEHWSGARLPTGEGPLADRPGKSDERGWHPTTYGSK